jgi:hypothetical protein
MKCVTAYDSSGACRSTPPSPRSDDRPDRLDESEWPGPLQESVGGSQRAGGGEAQNKPATAPFEGVAHHPRGNCEQAKQREQIHAASPDPFPGLLDCRGGQFTAWQPFIGAIDYGLRAAINHQFSPKGSFSIKRSSRLIISKLALRSSFSTCTSATS